MTNMQNVPNNRFDWIDWSKAVLIILMVLGHSSMPVALKTLIYAFHMPAFFVLSGYLYKSRNLLKTALSFLIPLMIFSALNYVAYVATGQTENVEGKFLLTLFPGYWFIEVLFLIRLLCGDISTRIRITDHRWYYVFAIVLVLIISSTRLIYQIDGHFARLLVCMPFFIFGMFLKDCSVPFCGKWKCVPLFIACLFISWFYGRCDVGDLCFGASYILYVIMACTMSYLFFSILDGLKNNRFIYMMSIGTLVILGIHRIILAIFHKIDVIHPIIAQFSWIVGTVCVCVIGYYLISFLKKYFPAAIGIVNFSK